MSDTISSRSHRKRNDGFTIVELLVVISIIALLVSILLPSLGKARLAQRRLLCLTRQRSIGQALSIYAGNNKGLYPKHRGSVWHDFADAYGWRDDYPYSGSRNRPALGFGLLVTSGLLSQDSLGETIHCPSLENRFTTAKGHCMDLPHPWGFGGSGWKDNPGHRIIGGFNYRGTSYGWVNGVMPNWEKVPSNFVLVVDTPDFRMRGQKSANNEHGGYNIVFADGSGTFFADGSYTVDALAALGGGRVDGRGQAANDELIYEHLSTVR